MVLYVMIASTGLIIVVMLMILIFIIYRKYRINEKIIIMHQKEGVINSQIAPISTDYI